MVVGELGGQVAVGRELEPVMPERLIPGAAHQTSARNRVIGREVDGVGHAQKPMRRFGQPYPTGEADRKQSGLNAAWWSIRDQAANHALFDQREIFAHQVIVPSVSPHELILADAGYCSIAGIEYVWQHGADVLVRVNPQSFVAYSAYCRRISLLPRLRTLSKVGQLGEWRVVLYGQSSAFAGRLCAVRKSDCAIQKAHRRLLRRASKKQMITRPGTFEFAKYVIVFTTLSNGSTAERSGLLPYALAN